MSILTNEIILEDIRKVIVDYLCGKVTNFFDTIALIFFGLVFIISCIFIKKCKGKKYENFICVMFLCPIPAFLITVIQFEIAFNVILKIPVNSIIEQSNIVESYDWSISNETVINKKRDGGRYSSGGRIYFDDTMSASNREHFTTSSYHVKGEPYKKINEGDEMYVIRDSNQRIIKIYSTEKYRYKDDVKLLINKKIIIPRSVERDD